MKNHDIDSLLAAASPLISDANKHFVINTMQRIRMQSQHETFTSSERKTSAQPKWSAFMKLAHAHKVIFAIAAIVITGIVTFSGYAYAIGTDPVSLIRRWVEDDSVKLDMGGRQFEYGVTRNYSDAAITAFAELNLTDLAHYRAADRLQVPHAGVEHVSDPARARQYAYPTLAYIRTTDGNNISIEKVYLRGDKVTVSKDISEHATIPEDDMFYYHELQQVSPLGKEGKLVALYQNSFLRHTIGEQQATPVTTYFAFELTHPLQDYRDSDAALRETKPNSGPRWSSDSVMPLLEKNFGALSSLCMNNGADTCDMRVSGDTEKGQSFYGKTIVDGHTYGISNPHAISYGEGAPDNARPDDVIMRGIQGKIVQITDQEVVVKGSSGSLWHLAFTKSQQNEFKQTWNKDLRIGMNVNGSILERTASLDNRHISDEYIYSAKVY